MAFVNSNPQSGGHVSYIRMVLRLRIPLAIATISIAAVGLLASLIGVDPLLRPLAGTSATHPLTALCMIGVAVGVLGFKRFGRMGLWRYAIGAIVIGVCATRLMQAELTQISGAPFLDIFGPIGGFSGRFSVESALVLGMFAAAAVLRQGLSRWGIVCLIIGMATIFNTLLELSYGLTFFNGDVGVFSLLGMMCLAVSLITVYLHRPLVRVAFLVGNIGSQTRVMVFAAVLIPWTCGFFLHSVRDIEPAAIPFEAAMVSLITWSMVLILLTSAARLESTDVARRRAERDIAMMSRTDPQSRALNRFGMSELLDQAWVDFKGVGTQYALMVLDVAYLRRVNETFGNGPGEDVLLRVAQTLKPQLRDHDALARWSEDEFLILLKIKDIADIAIVHNRLTKALQDVSKPFGAGLDSEPSMIAPTFGTSHMQPEDQSARDMMTRADMALHFAKDVVNDSRVTPYELIDETDTMIFTEGDTLEADEDGRDEIAA